MSAELSTPPETPDLSGVIPEVRWLDVVDSTNSHLAALPAAEVTRLLASWNQTAGRGRLGRDWVSQPGHTLAMSLEIGPELMPDELSEQWLGAVVLGAGASIAEAISAHLPARASLKWPNDVMVSGKKVAGLLAERPEPRRVIIGMGLNVWTPEDQLPTDTSTSLAQQGLSDHDTWNQVFLEMLTRLIARLNAWRTTVSRSDWEAIIAQLDTLGQSVRVSYPDGSHLEGVALDLDGAGRLIVADQRGEHHVVHSADIWHLR